MTMTETEIYNWTDFHFNLLSHHSFSITTDKCYSQNTATVSSMQEYHFLTKLPETHIIGVDRLHGKATRLKGGQWNTLHRKSNTVSVYIENYVAYIAQKLLFYTYILNLEYFSENLDVATGQTTSAKKTSKVHYHL